MAGAEASADVTQDGPVAGSVLGLSVCTYSVEGKVEGCDTRYTFLTNPDGSPFSDKAEGVVLGQAAQDSRPLDGVSAKSRNAIIVLDPDANRPARVCAVTLSGF